jgi:hypothetical protein
MGLLNYIPGFQASQFGGWWNNNNDAVSGALGGLVGHGNDPRDIMKGAVGGFQHGRSVDEEQAIIAEKKAADEAAIAQEQQQQADTIQWLQQQGFEDLAEYARAGNGGEAWKLALERMNPETAQSDESFFAPIQGFVGDQPTFVQPGNRGTSRVLDLPEGFQPRQRFEKVDLGDEWLVTDTTTGQQQRIPKNGDVPAGFEQSPTGGGLQPMAGGPQAIEQQTNIAGARARVQSLDEQSDVVVEHIDRALEQANFWTTGISGATSGMFPGSPAYDLRATVTTIKANIGFAELQEMRMNSPTGGALGQVAVQELEMLQAVLGSLDPNQSEDQLRQSLSQIAQLLERQKMYRQEALKERYGQSPQMPPQANAGGWSVIGVE